MIDRNCESGTILDNLVNKMEEYANNLEALVCPYPLHLSVHYMIIYYCICMVRHDNQWTHLLVMNRWRREPPTTWTPRVKPRTCSTNCCQSNQHLHSIPTQMSVNGLTKWCTEFYDWPILVRTGMWRVNWSKASRWRPRPSIRSPFSLVISSASPVCPLRAQPWKWSTSSTTSTSASTLLSAIMTSIRFAFMSHLLHLSQYSDEFWEKSLKL